jgi:hypothetical protein
LVQNANLHVDLVNDRAVNALRGVFERSGLQRFSDVRNLGTSRFRISGFSYVSSVSKAPSEPTGVSSVGSLSLFFPGQTIGVKVIKALATGDDVDTKTLGSLFRNSAS